MVQYNYKRFLYFNKHKSQRAIAKETGIHRTTVKRTIKNSEQKYRMNVYMVENLVKYVENNYLLPRVEFKSFDILNME